ncbi:MAG: PilZ domain-containing protein, partial [Candidatus Eremiobacteraeota bacterium]|nr:PilZ domain-containing protein [Candidatus Eremiobacteraeota bacterium]
IRQGSARIGDLSAGGTRMISASELAPGSEISLRFTLPSGEREVYVTGRIVMSFFDGLTQSHVHGVAFTRIALADQEAIVRYVGDVLRRDGPALDFDRLVTQWVQSSEVPVTTPSPRRTRSPAHCDVVA